MRRDYRDRPPRPWDGSSNIWGSMSLSISKRGGTMPRFNPADLPAHERSLLGNPDQAYEKTKHLVPYIRAGSEAYKRGESFWGGTPQYERELTALKEYYSRLHGKAPARAAKPKLPTLKDRVA